MSETTKVSATSVSGVASAPSQATRTNRVASSDQIDTVFGANFSAIDLWDQRNGSSNSGQGGGNQNLPQREPSQDPFTPLVGRTASAFPASEEAAVGGYPSANLFLSELQHGVGVYEFTLKVVGGSLKNQGGVFNHLY